MQRFKNILVAVGEKTDSRVAVERAVILAQRNEARLTVVNTISAWPDEMPEPITPELPTEGPERVLDIIEEWLPDAELRVTPESPATLHKPVSDGPDGAEMPAAEAATVIREHIAEEEGRRLAQWVDFVRQTGVPVTGRLLYGRPSLEIIREVLRCEHDLVMITAEGRGGLRDRLFGSTAIHLMRKCPCPVWVMKPSQSERYTRMLAAVDPIPQDEEQCTVNTKIMDLATGLAVREQCELVVVHAWTFPAEQSLRRGYLVASSELDRWVRDAQYSHRRRLIGLLQPYPLQDLNARVYLLKGEPGSLIPELAAKLQVGLIVMGTMSRSRVAGPFIGSTAERILRQVDCSVLTVKPNGFVTPVNLAERRKHR